MTQLSNSQARGGVDPILSTVARGFKHANHVAQALFPTVQVGTRAGRITTFGREDFKIYNSIRSPGQNTKRVSFGYAGGPFALEDHSLEAFVPFESQQEAQAVPGIDLASMQIKKVTRVISLGLEKQSADLARLAASYAAGNKVALAGATRWDTTTGLPITDMLAGKEAVRAKIGMYPNTILFSPKAATAISNNPQCVDRFKYTGRDSVTVDMIAGLLRIPNVVIGEEIYLDGSDVQQDVWGTDVIMAYVDRTGIADMGSPSYGYTYQLAGYPMVEEPYQDRNAKSWIYPYTDSRAPVIAGVDGGYLIQTVAS